MKIALIGAELEENLGMRYMASALERKGHHTEIIPFNSEHDIQSVARRVITSAPDIAGLSMVFTNRGREFCLLAETIKKGGYKGHIIGGGPFASFNCENLLRDFPAFDSIALGEGEELICDLADHLVSPSEVNGLCYKKDDGTIATNPSKGYHSNLDLLSFPKRSEFHSYFGKPIASILTSRGCWRNCAFCSISAWYDRVGGEKFRTRSVENIIEEMKEIYNRYGVRIFNFQDDNFFLPDKKKALKRFESLREGLKREEMNDIAIAIKARPDSITWDSINVLDDLNLFRVFLGVENASENGLRNLNRRCTVEQALEALDILNDFDVHVAYNLLMFEPDTVLDDIRINLRFIERHIENPFNFCRAEAHAGTGLEAKLASEGRLLGDYFGLDYRIKDRRSEAFHQIANYAFFDRNFSDFGLHYFNMQVDFTFQLLRRFYPEALSQSLRGAVRSFIKETNIDTYKCLCQIYDFVESSNPNDQVAVHSFSREVREIVDGRSTALRAQGETVLNWLDYAYEHRGVGGTKVPLFPQNMATTGYGPSTYFGSSRPQEIGPLSSGPGWNEGVDFFGLIQVPVPYHIFKSQLSRQSEDRR